MGVCNCSIFCCTLLYVHSSIAIILMGKRELIALLKMSSWRLVMVERLFLAVPRDCLQFVIVVFPDHTHYFRFQKILNQFTLMDNCIVMNKAQTSKIGYMLAILRGFFSFLKARCSYRNYLYLF